MINIYYNDCYNYHSYISFFTINEPSFLDKELYEYIIEPNFSIFN